MMKAGKVVVALGLVIGAALLQGAAAQQTSVVSAVLPASRAVQLGTVASAFATVINTGSVTATACQIAAPAGLAADFYFQATDPATNAPIAGYKNVPVDIGAGQAKSFLIALTPHAAFAAQDVRLRFSCTNAADAPVYPGLNTLLLSSSTTPGPDVVALAATINGDGIVNLPGSTGTGFFAVATVNVGASATITASTSTGNPLPLALSICQTNAATGSCLAAPAATVTTSIAAGTTPTFAVFATGTGSIPFDPAGNRITVLFKDGSGAVKGATSVAVRTIATPAAPAISALTYSPTAVYVNDGGGTVTVTGTFSYTDANGGLASVTLSLIDASGTTVTKTTTEVPAGTPPASGALQGSVTFGTTVAGNYTIRVSVTDVVGLVSNELTGGFRIAPPAWIAKAPVPSASSMGNSYVAAASGSRVYVLDRTTMRIYDTGADSWTTGPSMPNDHGFGAIATAVNGVVYVIGGTGSSYQETLSIVDAFDTATGTWSTRKPMPTARQSAAAAVIDNRICVVGGFATPSGMATALNTMDCYDPPTDNWSPGSAMPSGRARLGFSALGSFGYAVGGIPSMDGGGSALATVERYDAAANSWSTIAALPTARSTVPVVGAGSLLFAIGGIVPPFGVLRTVEAYDPSLAVWKAKTPLPSSADGRTSAVQVGGLIYVFDLFGRTYQYTPADDIL